MSQRQYAPEAVFVNTMRYENLAARDAYLAENNAARQARLAKVTECLAETQTQELQRNLILNLAGEFNYVLRVTYYPAMGKGPELRQALEERVRGRGAVAGSIGAGLTTQIAAETPNMSINVLYPSLAGLEEWIDALQGDQAFRAFGAKIARAAG